ALRPTKTLLLLDTCEHLIDAAASLAAAITQSCPDVAVLATSREPLRIPGEVVYSLAPLDTPVEAASLTAADALKSPAVQLLVERARAATHDFALSDEAAMSASAICRQLDGLPLAIDLASSLVGVFGLAGLADGLHTPLLRIVQSDQRGASPRHRNLTAALDWSYDLLDDGERTALRRLAVFAGGFTLEGAGKVLGLSDFGEVGVVLARLHSKSLIANDITPKDLRFRLLQTTRAYAIEKLERVEGAHESRRRHAAYLIARLARDGANSGAGGEWRDLVADVRRALDWALSPQGDQALGWELVVACAPLWVELQLACELHTWTHRAVEAAEAKWLMLEGATSTRGNDAQPKPAGNGLGATIHG
ncbi:MAG: ATP-binding protein, partial [Caulobacteraceae bacterium]